MQLIAKALVFLLGLCPTISAAPSPQYDNAAYTSFSGSSIDNNATNSDASNATDAANSLLFDDLVTARFRYLASRYPGLQMGKVSAETQDGKSSSSIGDYTDITLSMWSTWTKKVLITRNQLNRPTTWTEIQEYPPSAKLFGTWDWDTRRVTLRGAFTLLNYARIQIPVTRVIILSFQEAPIWGPVEQPYYVLESLLAGELFMVGMNDGKIYYRHPGAVSALTNDTRTLEEGGGSSSQETASIISS